MVKVEVSRFIYYKDISTPENALKDDHNLQLLEEENTNLPDNSIMYLCNTPGSSPWWKITGKYIKTYIKCKKAKGFPDFDFIIT